MSAPQAGMPLSPTGSFLHPSSAAHSRSPSPSRAPSPSPSTAAGYPPQRVPSRARAFTLAPPPQPSMRRDGGGGEGGELRGVRGWWDWLRMEELIENEGSTGEPGAFSGEARLEVS